MRSELQLVNKSQWTEALLSSYSKKAALLQVLATLELSVGLLPYSAWSTLGLLLVQNWL